MKVTTEDSDINIFDILDDDAKEKIENLIINKTGGMYDWHGWEETND